MDMLPHYLFPSTSYCSALRRSCVNAVVDVVRTLLGNENSQNRIEQKIKQKFCRYNQNFDFYNAKESPELVIVVSVAI